MRHAWYQLPLLLQEERPDAERRSRLAIELTERRAERDRFFDGWEQELGYPREQSKFWDAYERGLQRCAQQLIGAGL